MYLEHFGLVVNPFGLSPRLDFLYRSTAFEESMAHLLYGLDNSEAIIMITGAIGSGKTMSLQSFMTNLGEHFDSALVTNTQVNTVELLKLILEDLGVAFPAGADKSDLLIAFKNHLIATNRAGKRVVIVIDEAQNLEGSVLEEVRLLTNLGQGESQPVQIILVGQPELATMVDAPGLAQLRQRIRVHYRFDPLDREEVAAYVNHRMAVAGCTRQAFRNDALVRIAEYSKGVPRLVNTIAGEALLTAFLAQRNEVRAEDVSPVDEAVPEKRADQAIPAARSTEPEPAAPVSPPVAGPAHETSARGHREAPPPSYARKRPRRGRRAVLAVLAVALLVAAGVFGYPVVRGYWDGWQTAGERATNSDTTTPKVQKAATAPEDVPRREVGTDEAAIAGAEPGASDSAAGSAGSVEGRQVAGAREAAETVAEAVSLEQVASRAGQVSDRVIDPDAYYVHLASFRTPDRAATFSSRLERADQSAVVLTREISGVTWNRVYIGPFDTAKAAEEAASVSPRQGNGDYFRIVRLPRNIVN